jgi:hypothetical protein
MFKLKTLIIIHLNITKIMKTQQTYVTYEQIVGFDTIKSYCAYTHDLNKLTRITKT